MQICVSIPSICPLQTLHKNPWILLPIGRRCVPVMEKPIVWRSGKRLRTAMCRHGSRWLPLLTIPISQGFMISMASMVWFANELQWYCIPALWLNLSFGLLAAWPQANVSASTVRDGTASVYHRFLTVSYTTLISPVSFLHFVKMKMKMNKMNMTMNITLNMKMKMKMKTMMTMMMMRRRRARRRRRRKIRKRRRRKRRKKEKKKKKKKKKKKEEEEVEDEDEDQQDEETEEEKKGHNDDNEHHPCAWSPLAALLS